MTVEELVLVCPPPASPVGTEGDWAEVEGALGVTLPEDYKRIIATYGTGTFGDFIGVYSPFRETADFGLVARSAKWFAALRSQRDQLPEMHPASLHPEPGGLLPWVPLMTVVFAVG